MKTVLINAKQLVADNQLLPCEISIRDGVIEEIGEKVSRDGAVLIDCKGNLVTPGFIDVHVHLREPGGEKKETIETGTQSAARGGYTTICSMPNTRPVPDNETTLKSIVKRNEESAHVRVLPYASITERLLGETLTNMEALKEAGAFAFTDDGVGIQTADMMLQAMQEAARLKMPVVAHCEDNSLIHKGVIHEGEASKALNVPGIPSICEAVQIARDVLLAEATGCHYHVCHVSTKESVRVIRDAKKAGIHVTAEVTPHHLLLNEKSVVSDDANYKMNPPLRGEDDQQALLEGLLDGTIDFIATDHAPHTEDEKNQGLLLAPFGIHGFETAFSLLHTHLVETGKITLKQLIDWMTIKPAEVFNMPYGKLEPGSTADITVVDINREIKIDKETFLSKGKNTPFHEWHVKGLPVMTIVEGKIVFEEASYGKATTRA
ncbi:dihydroorotase [Aquibacillus koreensis]|uniref:Dihydroorotase n=1 Tax=Aquibacillus koreensis TaxID=279446 RepID=A0A9X3WL12_9BACI|nr:dihydroorotase [Aquibacillus koreensis]MCT2538035.1 dihydroorotase [Aquibacillus koreensis]MDC3420558.1 dihydroorotase [Aquibacillus koreensis]